MKKWRVDTFHCQHDEAEITYKKTAEKLSRKNKQNKILPLQLFKSVIKSATKKQQGEGNITQVIIHLVHWKNFPKNVRVRIRG